MGLALMLVRLVTPDKMKGLSLVALHRTECRFQLPKLLSHFEVMRTGCLTSVLAVAPFQFLSVMCAHTYSLMRIPVLGTGRGVQTLGTVYWPA